jgi:Ca-activated chloride channel family protein
MIAALEYGDLALLDPWFLLGVPLALLALVLRLLLPRAALPAASTALFANLPTSLRARLVHLPLCLMGLAAAVLSVALARPVHREVMPTQKDGVDIMLVVDISSSMKLTDMDPQGGQRRVDIARARALDFAKARSNDRVGLITFARFAELRCPPTLDENAIAAFVRGIDLVPEGSELDLTSIGAGLAKGVAVLQKSQAKSKVIVLLTDGDNNVGVNGVPGIPPDDGIKFAVDAGVRVHAIGIGRGNPDPFGGMHALEFTAIKDAASRTGGKFFKARTDEELKETYAEIDRLEKSELQDPRFRTVDQYSWPLLAGLLLLALSLLLEFAWLRGAP